jgi:hypothetical protein
MGECYVDEVTQRERHRHLRLRWRRYGHTTVNVTAGYVSWVKYWSQLAATVYEPAGVFIGTTTGTDQAPLESGIAVAAAID